MTPAVSRAVQAFAAPVALLGFGAAAGAVIALLAVLVLAGNAGQPDMWIITATASETSTPSNTPTSTPSPTSSPTATPSSTLTASPTPTSTPTNTPTLIPTATPRPPTATATPTKGLNPIFLTATQVKIDRQTWTAPSPTEEIAGEVLCTLDGMNVRSEPSSSATILSSYRAGVPINVYETVASDGFVWRSTPSLFSSSGFGWIAERRASGWLFLDECR